MIKFKELDDKKKKMIILVTTLILFIGVSFAFIAAQLSGGIIGNANVTADTTDNLQFNVDKDIYLNPTQFNVVEGGDNLSDTAVGTATLLANSTNDNAAYTYYVYFSINYNDYIYTTEEQTPEIILTITNPNGEEVTSVDGLDYIDSGEVTGFDITTKTGFYNIAELYEITSASSINATKQEWTFTVTFMNLDTNQAENGGKTLEAEIILSREEKVTLANYIIDNVYVEDGVNGLYYHDGVGTYTNAELEAGDNSYRYAGGYEIADAYKDTYAIIDEMIEDLTYNAYYIEGQTVNVETEEGVINAYSLAAQAYCEINGCNSQIIIDAITAGDSTSELVNDFISYFNEKMENGDYDIVLGFKYNNKIYVEMPESGVSEDEYGIMLQKIYNQLVTDGYIVRVNNYVCFKNVDDECNDDDLFQIIGVFDSQVKLITYKSLGNYAWDENEGNDWSNSTINEYLNTIYLNNLEENVSLIANTKWIVGGFSRNNIMSNNVKNLYQMEKVTPVNNTTYNAKIGLMYASDYFYAANPVYWNMPLNDISVEDINWIWGADNKFMRKTDWTISYNVDQDDDAISISVGGIVTSNDVDTTWQFGIRPCFYLNSSTILIGGSGTISDPYRVA